MTDKALERARLIKRASFGDSENRRLADDYLALHALAVELADKLQTAFARGDFDDTTAESVAVTMAKPEVQALLQSEASKEKKP